MLTTLHRATQVMTDELVSYWGLEESYTHNVINHAEEYVRGTVHTNGMENYWSLVKRALTGTYISRTVPSLPLLGRASFPLQQPQGQDQRRPFHHRLLADRGKAAPVQGTRRTGVGVMLRLRGVLCEDVLVSRVTRRRLGLGLRNAPLNFRPRNRNEAL